MTLLEYQAAKSRRSIADRFSPGQYGRGSGRSLYSSTIDRNLPTPIDEITFTIVSAVQAPVSFPSLCDESDLVFSLEHSRHKPRSRPLNAGTALAADNSDLPLATLVRTSTPSETLEGDDKTSDTARGMPIIHSERN